MTTNQQTLTDIIKIWEKHSIEGDEINPTETMYFAEFLNAISEVLDNEQTRILKQAKEILDAEMKVYGTDKHGLSYEQLEEIIKK